MSVRISAVQSHLKPTKQLDTRPTMGSYSPLTTHVLDTARGKPAQEVPIEVSFLANEQWLSLAKSMTNSDGRCPGLLTPEQFKPGTYKVRFNTSHYLEKSDSPVFYPYVEVVFVIKDPSEHYHIPLLLSPYGYSTYRGS